MKGKIFTAQEVQSILSGNKTMFREAVKVQPTNSEQKLFVTISGNKKRHNRCSWLECDDKLNVKSRSDHFKCPYQVGQMIFCKESFGFQAPTCGISEDHLIYKSDNPIAIFATSTLGKEFPVEWKPASHMKQEQSRLTLQIKEIRVELLADISEEDAIAEGIEEITIPIFKNIEPKIKSWKWYKEDNFGTYSAIKSFTNLWNSTHKKPEEKFEANPWVWSIQFEVVK
jgi:hypothetical protein